MKRLIIAIAAILTLAGCANSNASEAGSITQADQTAALGETLELAGAQYTVYAVKNGEAYGPKPVTAADIKICLDETNAITGKFWAITDDQDRTLTPQYVTTDDFQPLYPLDLTPVAGGDCFRGWLPMPSPQGFKTASVKYTWADSDGTNATVYHLTWKVS